MSEIDWKGFESLVSNKVLETLTRLLDRQKKPIYAAAFHEFYCEMDGPIAMPCLAANSDEAAAIEAGNHWSSADWKWIEITYSTPEIRKAHKAIEKEACREGGNWEKTQKRFVDAFIKVAKELSKQLGKHPQVTKDFGVFVFLEDEAETEIDALKRCMSPAKFKRLFPDMQAMLDDASHLAASSPDTKLARYREDLREHEQAILKLGEQAIPMLRDALNDDEQCWAAADLIAKIGVADPLTIEILKDRAWSGMALAFHDTIALALLGEIEFLLELAREPRTQIIAIRGISSLYSTLMNHWCQHPQPLDYRPMERLMAIPGCEAKVFELFSGSRSITPEDVDEALRGLESQHDGIREHAVCTLGNPKLGKKLAGKILPALAARLQDTSATARRLAIVSLSYWKKQASPFAGEVRKLFKDPDPQVASFAKQFISAVE